MSVQYHIISKTRKMVMPKPQNLRKLGKEKKTNTEKGQIPTTDLWGNKSSLKENSPEERGQPTVTQKPPWEENNALSKCELEKKSSYNRNKGLVFKSLFIVRACVSAIFV